MAPSALVAGGAGAKETTTDGGSHAPAAIGGSSGTSTPDAGPSPRSDAGSATPNVKDAATSPAAEGGSAGAISDDAAGLPEEDASVVDHDAALACPDCCPDGFPRGVASAGTHQIAPFTPSPADVTVCPSGDAFLTLDGQDELWRVPARGAPVRYAGLKGIQPAGVACDERGRLFVAAFSIRAGSSFAAPGIVLVENEHAQPRALAQPLGAAAFATPNGVAFAPGAGIYATDTLGGVVIREAENAQGQFEATVVARNLLGVNGIAYDPLSRKLYVSNSLTQEVSSFAVAADGTLGTIKKEWTGQGTQLDGLAVDEKGSVYVANYGQGPVLRVPDEMMVAMVKNPSSLAFRGGSLLVVDYHLNQPTVEGGLYSAELGRCGAELFGRR